MANGDDFVFGLLLLIIGLVAFASWSQKMKARLHRQTPTAGSRALLFVLKHPVITVLGIFEVGFIINMETAHGFAQFMYFVALLPTTTLFGVALLWWWRKRDRTMDHNTLVDRVRAYRERMKQAGLDEIDVMDGWTFEQRMEIHFETMGWTVLRTPGSGDFGADLVLTTPDQRKVVIQCKRYSGPVGKEAVEEVLRGKQHYRADLAMVVTNSYLSKGALQLAKENTVDVWNRDELMRQLLDAKAEDDFRSQRDEKQSDPSQAHEENTKTSIPECFRILFFDDANVTEADVVRRYRKLSSVAHPDAGGGNAAFVRLQKAKDECLEYLKVNAV